MNVSALAVFVGGVLTVFAPCAAMLLPSFFAYAFSSRRTLGARTAVFTLGLMVAFVPIGAFAGSLGGELRSHTALITTIAGIIVCAFGVAQIFAFSLPTPSLAGKLMSRPLQPAPSHTDPDGGVNASKEPSALAVFLLGVGYAIAGIGCSGPILGAVLATTLVSGSALNGFIHALLFALGMSTPVVILAWLWDVLKVSQREWLRPRPLRIGSRLTTVMNVVSGVIFVILGLTLVFLNGSTNLPSLLSVEQQISLESKVAQMTAAVPGYLTVALIAVVVALLVISWKGKGAGDK